MARDLSLVLLCLARSGELEGRLPAGTAMEPLPSTSVPSGSAKDRRHRNRRNLNAVENRPPCGPELVSVKVRAPLALETTRKRRLY